MAAGKRPAGDAIEDDHTPKRVRQTDTNNSVNPSTTARIPPTLTSYKQEHTILYVVLPGSTSDMVPIKLRSVMTISTFFNSVSAAAGVTDYEHMAVAVLLGGEDGGHILVRQNLLDSFECFLEIVDDAPCWEEEGGRMALQLQLRWRHTFELNIRV